MSLTPISISQLPVAPLPILQSDVVILSRGVNQDYQTTMNAIWQINMSIFPSLASPAATDLMMIYDSSNVYSVQFSQVGFVTGTSSWFYQSSPPAGWSLVAIPNDAVLGVVDSTNTGIYITGGTQINGYNTGIDGAPATRGTGTWNMLLEQLPQHVHGIDTFRSGGGTNNIGIYSANTTDATTKNSSPAAGGNRRYSTSSGLILSANTSFPGYGTWRPTTAVGIVCQKL